ncbi:MAG: hypothetical protein B6D41_20240 [Chloroflexi bacterium UTCFX4]|jgi:hypothetical protein|nr:MAG: hypothetical protein B6D41_20240 [Chloroflexi bacterium UTCFX4]
MQALDFQKLVAADKSNLLGRLLKLLDDQHIGFCVIGSAAVSAYAEPLLGLDFDIVVTSYQLGRFEAQLANTFFVKRAPRFIEITMPGSALRVNVFTEARYSAFVERAALRDWLGMPLPIARIEDVLSATLWAHADSTRAAWQRLKDLTDVARLLHVNPKLRAQTPPALLAKLETQAQ